MSHEPEQFIEWFRSASPYIRVHRGNTFVVQFGDDVIRSDRFTDLVHDLALLNCLGIRLIIVYGNRQSIEEWLNKEGIKSEFHHGVRITDSKTLECVKQAAGSLRIEIESRLSMGLGNTPMSHSGLTVSSGNYITARPKGIVDGIDYRFTGDVRSVDVKNIETKLDNNEIVIVPPVAYSTTGETFNLSACKLASSVASAMSADKLIYLMDTDSIPDVDGQRLRQTDVNGIKELLSSSSPEDDNYRYIQATVEAVEAGVQRVHLIDPDIDGAIIQELFTRDGAGTMVSATPYDVLRKATINDISGIFDIIEPLEKKGVLVTRSREKLELEIDHFILMERDGVIIACAALYPYEGIAAEIACLAVKEEYASHGRGEQLLSMLEREAKRLNLDKLFILTTQAEHWFLEKGFHKADIEDLPGQKQALYNIQRNAKVLMKILG